MTACSPLTARLSMTTSLCERRPIVVRSLVSVTSRSTTPSRLSTNLGLAIPSANIISPLSLFHDCNNVQFCQYAKPVPISRQESRVHATLAHHALAGPRCPCRHPPHTGSGYTRERNGRGLSRRRHEFVVRKRCGDHCRNDLRFGYGVGRQVR